MEHLRFLPGRWTAVGVSRRTWRRWMAGTARIPFAVLQLARILAGGELIQGGETWAGWAINRRGELIDPEGISHTPHTIRSWFWCAQQLSALRAAENQSKKIKRISTPSDGDAITQALHKRLK